MNNRCLKLADLGMSQWRVAGLRTTRSYATRSPFTNSRGKLQVSVEPSPVSAYEIYVRTQIIFQRRRPHRLKPFELPWRKNHSVDKAIYWDRIWNQCHKVVKMIFSMPGNMAPLIFLKLRKKTLGLKVDPRDFLEKNPGLFDVFKDQITPEVYPIAFIRPSPALLAYAEEIKRIRADNEAVLADKLYRVIYMCINRRIEPHKLGSLKRSFFLPKDFMTEIILKYPHLFRVAWEYDMEFVEVVVTDNVPLSVIEMRAKKKSLATGKTVKPAFINRLSPGKLFTRRMFKWTMRWTDLPYVSPYTHLGSTQLRDKTMEIEKRHIAVIHELLSLSVLRRMRLSTIAKFISPFKIPAKQFEALFSRYPGIFYVSKKGLTKTVVLLEAYEYGELLDREPLVAIKEKFCDLLQEGKRKQGEHFLYTTNALFCRKIKKGMALPSAVEVVAWNKPGDGSCEHGKEEQAESGM